MLAEALARMPHRGAMRLIAAVEDADSSRIRCRATDHAVPDHPLRLDGVLYAAALVELGAQTAAAHASLFGMRAAHSGLVLALNNLELRRVRIEDPAPLRMQAERVVQIEGAAAYRFAVSQHHAPLLTGEILISMVTA